jgi:hypothetical protein
MADSPFDDNGRLLAYVAPNYTETERRTMTRAQQATFNLPTATDAITASDLERAPPRRSLRALMSYGQIGRAC